MKKKKPIFIAEVKTQSPFGFKAQHSWDELFDLANQHGDWISIHTNPLWGGSFDLLREARNRTNKPILAKGIHGSDNDIRRAANAGANYILVAGRVPQVWSSSCEVIIEPLNFAQFLLWDNAFPKHLQKFAFNRRDLSTGLAKSEDFNIWRSVTPWLCQASRIRNMGDVRLDTDAFLVGSNLPFFIQSLKK